ncbi:MAG: glycosyltransferase family 9 protein [Planctomycetota bacterium]
MNTILIVKTAALGDVLRTTSILPGLRERYAPCAITWLTAHGAVDLVRTHPDVARVIAVDTQDEAAVDRSAAELARERWTRVVSLDDELALCRLASRLSCAALSGATLDAQGERAYTSDVAPWFDMGLLSRFGKARADQLKIDNTQSHPAIFAAMLGVAMGKPKLVLTPQAEEFGRDFVRRHELDGRRPCIGLNTGAGGRWLSKQLPIERTVELAARIARSLPAAPTFVVFGGDAEVERNRGILAGLARSGLPFVDAGCDNPLLAFAAAIRACDLLVTSDSLALHVAVAQDVPLVAFFAPTSAAEIELYGLGEKVVSTAPDACSYRADADNTSLTAERIARAALAVLGRRTSPKERPWA